MQVEGQQESEELKVYLPGMALAEGEELEVDPSAYVMLHELNAEWPCLSFDIVRDGGGEERTAFPMSGFLVTGSQADSRHKNMLYMLRCTNLRKTLQKLDDEANTDTEEEADSDSEDDDDDEEGAEAQIGGKTDPRHYCLAIPHDGGVNRIRSINAIVDGALRNVLTATWSDTGRVHVWDLQSAYSELAEIPLDSPSLFTRRQLKPIHAVTKHRTEGYALAWTASPGGFSLLSGDCDGQIMLTDAASERISSSGEAFRGHTGSVEDLQWSPSENTVFASASVDHTVRLWDIRLPHHQAALSAVVHDCDVNVLSWNRNATHMLATGADDGIFATWDLRRWAPSTEAVRAEPILTSNWHQASITSIEWSPHDASVLAVAGADDQLSIWDFALDTADTEAEASQPGDRQVPSQLLFIHQGQKEIKELHWHPQLSGVLVSTALSGFNIFKTISV